jgi:hypothetical protein
MTKLTGTIPAAVGKMKNLFHLDLRNTGITGTIDDIVPWLYVNRLI